MAIFTTSPATSSFGGLNAMPTPEGVPVGDDVAGLEGERRREMLDQGEAIEDQLLRARLLPQLAVDPGAQAERMGIGDLVRA